MPTRLPNPAKQDLRRRLKTRRQVIPQLQRARLDLALEAQVLGFFEEQSGRRLSAFHAFRGEPDLLPALAHLHAAGYQVCLPVLHGDEMQFRRWMPGAPMTPNRYGIPEPLEGSVCPASMLDWVLMPLVAYSRQGGRLGMGGGYYDRCFAFKLESGSTAAPHLVGVAYGLQEVDSLPVDPWDVPLDAVITDRGVKRFSL